ncbi:universal stress protein [Streptomyces sp. RB6PN25]|uniref:Universal stress protein n=1 Tax=Streptomyces humicola TaxID=2953240 RepID=A0ABT1PSH2_9ACTN|nr:universal stress protein [Streptomyces humicola]MCQ4080623.1 universal stress protein [Streptomyces humicola]
MVRPVTAGLNGSPESVAAAHWAAGEAQMRGLPLKLVYAWEWLPKHLPPTPSEPAGEQHWPDRMMDQTAKDIASRQPDLQITVETIENLPDPALLDVAKESELLALGSRGLGTVAGFFAGSVGLAVVAKAERPVVLVRAVDEPGTGEASGTPREVLVGADLGHPCEAVIEFAFDFAAVHKAPLRAVYAWHSPPSYGYIPDGIDFRVEEREALATVLRPLHKKHPDVTVHDQVVFERPAQHLVQAASDARLLVVGRRTQRPMGTRLGPVAHAVIHHAPCPVAVVPHD